MRKHIAVSALALALCLVMCTGFVPVTAANSAPVAENFEFETFRGVSFGGQLAAVDPEGDTLSFEITTQPVKGTIELGDDGSFVYTPAEDKKATDSEGNSSQEATVIIRLVKNKSVSYVDMNGSGSYRSAVKLAECGAFIGKQMGGEYYFEPEQTMSRGEFLNLCLNVTGADLLSGVVSTGFTDDGDIPDWQKACVASAVKCGVVKGRYSDGGAYFDADSPISRAEAMVMLDRSLKLSDVSYLSAGDAVPSWAAQAAANLTACNVISSFGSGSAPLTRAEAADMLAAAMELIENR